VSQQKRFLYVVDSLDRFGATRQLDLLTREISHDHDVHVAVLGGDDTIPACMASEDVSRQFHFLAASPTDQTSFRTLTRSGLRLRKLIRRIEPAIIHAWCQPAERVTLAASTEFKSIHKFVTELHIRPSTQMTMEAIDQRLGQPVLQYIVPHEEVKKSLVSHQYHENKISIIPNAIGALTLDPEIARRKLIQLGGLGDQVRLAGAVAPLVPRSRIKDLIWATDLLTCIRNDFHFFIFGRGSQRERLERFASQTEAKAHIHFVDSELHAFDLIPGLDFFWQSHLNEPMPSAMHYAMCNSVPVVSVYGPGTSESIVHQETGFAANFGARDEFARWTKYLLEQTEPGRQLARQGKESLEVEGSSKAMADSYREAYEQFI
jgi:glycosyltransferase involved in cell wall biosynthesis